MRLLLHAVATPDAGAPAMTGPRGQRCVCLEQAGLAAWATRFSETVTPFGRADLLEHHDIVSRLAAQLDGLLPARFPTWLVDEDAVRSELTRRHAELVEALARVRGRCELAITTIWTSLPEDETPPEAATPGRKYLLGR